MNADFEYFRLLNRCLYQYENGRIKKNRTGIDTVGVFGEQARFSLAEGFPLLTTKKVFFKGIVHELLWFLSGSTNIKYLVDNDVHIWDEWAYAKYIKTRRATSIMPPSMDFSQKEFIAKIKSDNNFAKQFGELGEGTYGGMWRQFPFIHYGNAGDPPLSKYDIGTGWDYQFCVDQIRKVIDTLKSNPDDRRMIVSAWHPYWVDHCALPPCHVMFQFHTEELTESERFQIFCERFNKKRQDYEAEITIDKLKLNSGWTTKQLDDYDIPRRRLNLQLYQRSCDLFLGVPFNIASYSLLLQMVAQVSNMVAGEFIHTYGDLHLYTNHIEQAKLQLSREPRALPTVKLNSAINNIFQFKYEDITLESYDPHPAIKGEVAV